MNDITFDRKRRLKQKTTNFEDAIEADILNKRKILWNKDLIEIVSKVLYYKIELTIDKLEKEFKEAKLNCNVESLIAIKARGRVQGILIFTLEFDCSCIFTILIITKINLSIIILSIGIIFSWLILFQLYNIIIAESNNFIEIKYKWYNHFYADLILYAIIESINAMDVKDFNRIKLIEIKVRSDNKNMFTTSTNECIRIQINILDDGNDISIRANNNVHAVHIMQIKKTSYSCNRLFRLYNYV